MVICSSFENMDLQKLFPVNEINLGKNYSKISSGGSYLNISEQFGENLKLDYLIGF